MVLIEPMKPALMACVANYIGGQHTSRETDSTKILSCTDFLKPCRVKKSCLAINFHLILSIF